MRGTYGVRFWLPKIWDIRPSGDRVLDGTEFLLSVRDSQESFYFVKEENLPSSNGKNFRFILQKGNCLEIPLSKVVPMKFRPWSWTLLLTSRILRRGSTFQSFDHPWAYPSRPPFLVYQCYFCLEEQPPQVRGVYSLRYKRCLSLILFQSIGTLLSDFTWGSSTYKWPSGGNRNVRHLIP